MNEQRIDTIYARTFPGPVPEYARLSGTVEADVCVIGGGLAGLNTALGLLERGKTVALVEAKNIGFGASGRNAGFVAKGYAAGESSLAAKLGLEAAQKLVALTKNARKLIKSRIAAMDIDCGPVVDGVLTVSWRNSGDALKKYIAAANRDFDLGFEFWPRERVREHCKTERYFDGIYSPHDFQFDPFRYLHGLARMLAARGARVFEQSPVLKITSDGAGWAAHTVEGIVRAQHVVVCCAIYSEGLNKKLESAVFPVRTYLMATKPMEESLFQSSINTRHALYDTRFCSDYYRRLPGNRLLWGGRVALWANPSDIAGMMLDDMFKVYPQLRGHVEPEVAWSGLLAYAPHKMPHIGELQPGYWCNTAFGGHGLAPTTVGGEAVAAAIAEGDIAYKNFVPFKPYFTGGKAGRYAAQMVYWWWRLRDFLHA